MTHTFAPGDPTWTGEVGMTLNLTKDIKGEANYHYRSYNLEMVQNIGTHLDSPSHFIEDGLTESELDFSTFSNIPLVVIDIRHKVKHNVDYELSVTDIQLYESKHGKIPKHSLVAAYSGW